MRGLPWLVGPLVLLTLALACGEGAERPHVLLITLDTLRSDHCSTYGYERETTPRLTGLAAAGVLASQAYAPMATTGPSHATMFTALYPVAHHVVRNGLVLDETHETLAERLADEGYETAGIVGSFVLNEKFGYHQGFAHWEDRFKRRRASVVTPRWEGHDVEGGFDRRANDATDRAITWLEGRDPGRPFFLFVHYFDPHSPYDPPAEELARFPPLKPGPLPEAVARYDAEIAYTDAQIGNLLDALERMDLAEDTLVIVVGDHGEELMDHGYMEHGVHIYEETVLVPFMLRWPDGLPAGRVLESPVELVDLAPTVLSLLDLPAPEGSQGQDLSPMLRGERNADPHRPVFLHRRPYKPGVKGDIPVNGEKLGIRVGQWKYIVGEDEGTYELFDLASDPDERRNLYTAQPGKAAELAARLDAWHAANARSGEALEELTPEDRARLEALGYTR